MHKINIFAHISLSPTHMKQTLISLVTLTLCIFCVFPAPGQCPEFAYLNGTYVKKGTGYTIEAKIDFNGWKAPENSYYRMDFDSDLEPVEKYYGYIKLTSGDHQEGYDIVSAIAGGDGPILILAHWQTGIASSTYPSFYNNTLTMDSGMMFEEKYMHETLTKKKPVRTTGPKFVDLGLSVKWSTCNVGASSPEDHGEYYSWGLTTPRTFTWDLRDTSIEEISGTNNDIARLEWGKEWRIPTNEEMNELIGKCTWTWISDGSKTGYRITGPNGNSIFLPASGLYQGSVDKVGELGYYWTSTRCPKDVAYNNGWGLHFDRNGKAVYSWWQANSYPIRPVMK